MNVFKTLVRKMNELTEKTLLVLTPCYPDKRGKVVGDPFVKYPVDEMKRFFKEIIVISPQPYFPSLLTKFKFLEIDLLQVMFSKIILMKMLLFFILSFLHCQ